MKRFKEFLREHVEERRTQEMLNHMYEILDKDPEAQKNLEEIDDIEDSELEESVVTEGTGSPFGDDGGTIYNGGTDEVFGTETEKNDDLLAEDEETYTDTFKFLQQMKKNPPSFADIKSNFQRFRINDKTGELEERSNKFFGEYKPVTPEQMKEFLEQLNDKNILKRTVYRVDTDGRLLSKRVVVNPEDPDNNDNAEVIVKESPIKNPRLMDSICKHLNKMFQDTMPDRLFWWENKGGSKEKVLTITQGDIAKNKNNDNLHDFKDVKYAPILDKDLQKQVGIVLTSTRNRKRVKDTGVIGYENGSFTRNGVPMTAEETSKFIRTRNGMPNPDSSYWDKFQFLKEGGKIGKTVGSFSLPPGVTCLDGVPCAHEGCYAYRSFRNPTVRACWFSNLSKLQEGKSADGIDRFKQFEDECVKFIEKHGLTHFRFHVSGDVDIGANKSKYIDSICNIAKRSSGVQFWTYTKDYAAWESASVPANLVVILSAWGKFRPNPDMTNRHPVAFLYDADDPKIMEYMEGINPAHFNEYEAGDHDDPVVFCPCSDPAVKENVTCDKCKICFTRSAHHNVAFHKH